ncbi:enoyl-CoA hydratase/isomerase family protein [Ideonella sp. B508-1]|uniref:enoyl-CoA hydratase/isomerase family protein n=1 Tax=Ideonella sp. B508-1 TaxID=137716 RepID=UPI000346561C|nr:enoyl-CoA hydratase-related protein [Ideonella sp. B508-1]
MFETRVEEGIARVTMSRSPVNALSEEWGDALDGELDALGQRDDWRVLHLRSDQKVFAAGADLSQIHGWTTQRSPARRLSSYIARLQAVFRRLERLPQVVLAEIGGAALGGGLELALSCDLRVAAVEAKIGLPEVGLGLIPGLGGTQRLTRLCGAGIAGRMILGAEVIDGAVARELGIVQWAVPRAELASLAVDIARRVAALPTPALRAAKELIRAANPPVETGFALERELGGQLLDTPEARALIVAFLRRSGKTVDDPAEAPLP